MANSRTDVPTIGLTEAVDGNLLALTGMLAVLEKERGRAECVCCRTLAARLAEAIKAARAEARDAARGS